MSCGTCSNSYDSMMGLSGYYQPNGMSGLGEMTDVEAMKVIEDHFKALPTTSVIAISSELVTGKYSLLATEIRKCVEKICVQGGGDRIGGMIKQYWYVFLAIGIGIIYMIGKKK